MLEELKFSPVHLSPQDRETIKGKALEAQVVTIQKRLNSAVYTFKRDSVYAGFMLCKLKEERLYLIASRYSTSYTFLYGDAFVSEPFELFCKNTFGLSKSTLYALIDVAKKFGDENGELKPIYSEYHYSQLVEMTSLPENMLSRVNSSMSISEIRKLKKDCKSFSSEAEPVSDKEKTPPPPTNKYVFDDMKVKRDEFKISVKRLFEKYDYKLTLCNRSQGGQAFGAALFDFLNERGFFDANKNPQIGPLV